VGFERCYALNPKGLGMDLQGRNMRAWSCVLMAFLICLIAYFNGREAASQVTTAQNATLKQTVSLQPAAASVSSKLDVPAPLATSPFDTERSLVIPPGFGIRVWARVPKARFMALTPNGDVLVSIPGEGRIVLLREREGDTPQQFDFATGLNKPHDMVFHVINGVTYLYFSESSKISRTVYQPGATQIGPREILIDHLPDASAPEFGDSYQHELKNIAIGPDDKLYVSIASSCNACATDVQHDPVLGSIYQYSADGKNGRLFAHGLRNAEGLDFIPGTNNLWTTVNNRDQIPVPLDIDVDGDGNSDFGKVIPSYVNANPVDFFTAVRDGGDYGWPFCDQLVNGDVVPDYDTNRSGTKSTCSTVDRASKALRAHSAPLGMHFLHSTAVSAAYRRGAVAALHGCWNCTALEAGYKVIYFPFDEAGIPGNEMDLVTGFVTSPIARTMWGRPVDVIADAHGNILISDDFAGALYQLYPK